MLPILLRRINRFNFLLRLTLRNTASGVGSSFKLRDDIISSVCINKLKPRLNSHWIFHLSLCDTARVKICLKLKHWPLFSTIKLQSFINYLKEVTLFSRKFNFDERKRKLFTLSSVHFCWSDHSVTSEVNYDLWTLLTWRSNVQLYLISSHEKLFSVHEEEIHLLASSFSASDHYAISEVNYGLWTVSILHSSKLFTISDSFNYGDTRREREKKNRPLLTLRRNDSMDFHFGARRNIARNNPPIHHCWSWQLKK